MAAKAGKILATVSAASAVVSVISDQVTAVHNARASQGRASETQKQWKPTVQAVVDAVKKAIDQALEEANVGKERAEEAVRQGEHESAQQLLEVAKELSSRVDQIDIAQMQYLAGPLDSVQECMSNIDVKSKEYGERWLVGQWWHSTDHETNMVQQQACIERSMQTIAVGMDIFNAQHIVDVKRTLVNNLRAVDSVRREVRKQADRYIAAVDGGLQMVAREMHQGLATIQTIQDGQHRSLQTLQALQRENHDHYESMSAQVSSQHREAMSSMDLLHRGQAALSDQVMAAQQALSGQIAETHGETMQGINALADSQRLIHHDLHHNHNEAMAALSLTRQDIAFSQRETAENFRRLDPTLTALTAGVAETRGQLEVLASSVSGLTDMHKETVRAILADKDAERKEASRRSDSIYALLDRRGDEIAELRQELDKYKTESAEWQYEFRRVSLSCNQTLHEERRDAQDAASVIQKLCFLSCLTLFSLMFVVLIGLCGGWSLTHLMHTLFAILVCYVVASVFILGVDVLASPMRVWVGLLSTTMLLRDTVCKFVHGMNRWWLDPLFWILRSITDACSFVAWGKMSVPMPFIIALAVLGITMFWRRWMQQS